MSLGWIVALMLGASALVGAIGFYRWWFSTVEDDDIYHGLLDSDPETIEEPEERARKASF